MPRDEAHLLDMLLAARDTMRLTAGREWPAFRDDEVLQRAMMHCLQVTGEAARNVSQGYAGDHPEVPWRWVRLRNRLVHEYFRIRAREVFEAIRDEVPVLATALEPLVAGGGE